jgi:hypothetical protein
MYLQLPSITGGRSSIRNLRTRHAVVTGTHITRPVSALGQINCENKGKLARTMAVNSIPFFMIFGQKSNTAVILYWTTSF